MGRLYWFKQFSQKEGRHMPLTLKSKAVGVWVEYPDTPDVQFLIRPVPFSKVLEIRTNIKKKVAVPGAEIATGIGDEKVPLVVDDWDDGVFSKSLFDYSLQDWKGQIILDEPILKELIEKGELKEGQEPSREQIRSFFFDTTEIRDFITNKARELAGSEKKLKDDERKNLSSSQSG
jgi:hypothetical protein